METQSESNFLPPLSEVGLWRLKKELCCKSHFSMSIWLNLSLDGERRSVTSTCGFVVLSSVASLTAVDIVVPYLSFFLTSVHKTLFLLHLAIVFYMTVGLCLLYLKEPSTMFQGAVNSNLRITPRGLEATFHCVLSWIHLKLWATVSCIPEEWSTKSWAITQCVPMRRSLAFQCPTDWNIKLLFIVL